jgi:hypothetical protein
MSDQDLERRLRTERGPREEGYLAAQLPPNLEGNEHGRRSALLSTAVVLPAAAAGVLVVAVAGALVSGGPGPIPGTSPSPSASAKASPAEPAAPVHGSTA